VDRLLAPRDFVLSPRVKLETEGATSGVYLCRL